MIDNLLFRLYVIAIDRQPIPPERLKFLSQVCALGPTGEARYCRQLNVNCITFLTFTCRMRLFLPVTIKIYLRSAV